VRVEVADKEMRSLVGAECSVGGLFVQVPGTPYGRWGKDTWVPVRYLVYGDVKEYEEEKIDFERVGRDCLYRSGLISSQVEFYLRIYLHKFSGTIFIVERHFF
jgi:hypothetical protein